MDAADEANGTRRERCVIVAEEGAGPRERHRLIGRERRGTRPRVDGQDVSGAIDDGGGERRIVQRGDGRPNDRGHVRS
jgi:hypothetical protein